MDWNGGMENGMDRGILSAAEGTISHFVLASSTLSDPENLLYCS